MFKDLAREQEQATGRVNISELSRETGFDRKTVRYYLSCDHPPVTPRMRTKPSKLDLQTISSETRNIRLSRVRLLDEIRARAMTEKATTGATSHWPTVPVLLRSGMRPTRRVAQRIGRNASPPRTV